MRALLFLLLLPLPTLADDRLPPPPPKPGVITVHGEAITKVAPDQVTLPVTIREENKDIKAAKEKHDKKLESLLKLASDTGIAKDNIQTSYTSVNPQYDYREHGKPKLLSYQVTSSINIKLDDISKLGDFMNGVIDLGITEMGDVSYSIKDEEKIKEDTLAKAMTQAYDKASHLATAAKVTLDKPINIDEGNDAETHYPIHPIRFMAVNAMMRTPMPMAAHAPAPDLPEGLVEIRQDVTVTYQLQNN